MTNHIACSGLVKAVIGVLVERKLEGSWKKNANLKRRKNCFEPTNVGMREYGPDMFRVTMCLWIWRIESESHRPWLILLFQLNWRGVRELPWEPKDIWFPFRKVVLRMFSFLFHGGRHSCGGSALLMNHQKRLDSRTVLLGRGIQNIQQDVTKQIAKSHTTQPFPVLGDGSS